MSFVCLVYFSQVQGGKSGQAQAGKSRDGVSSYELLYGGGVRLFLGGKVR